MDEDFSTKRIPDDLEARPYELCVACSEKVMHPVDAKSLVPELKEELDVIALCSWSCAQDYCRFLVQESPTQMAMVTKRFRPKMR